MNVIYTGKQQDFTDPQTKKLKVRFEKVSKMVDGRGEKELHVIFSSQRHLTKAEAALNYYGHSAVGAASESDPFLALTEALEKLEKQVAKLRTKWRDATRTNGVKAAVTAVEAVVNETGPRIRRVPVSPRRKPMTLEEAVLAIGKDPYVPFRDTDTGMVSVLIRRPDGHFDLVEG